MITAYIIIPDGHETLAVSLEYSIRKLLNSRQIDGTASWYYDEFAEEGTEFGVRIDVQETTEHEWQRLLDYVSITCRTLYRFTAKVELA
jgi:hypothetical protein